MIKDKNILIKLFSIGIYMKKGSVLNRFNSILSPGEFQESTSVKNLAKVELIINYIAPFKYLGSLKRIGGNSDGSYVIPSELINDKTYLISGGIADNNKFEMYSASQGVTGLQIDNSIIAPPKFHKNMRFISSTLSGKDDSQNTSLKTLIKKAPKSKKLFLKLDIEGGEIEALGATPVSILKRIDCLVIEIHNLSSITEKGCKIPILLQNLSRSGLKPIYLQSNNACLSYTLGGILIPDNVEVTYVKTHQTVKPDINYIKKIKRLAKRNKQNFAQINIDHILIRNL
jgi:hypothetical protein